MDINSIQGMNAYTANALMADTASVQTNNNKEATNIELDKENRQTLQEAFQVDITQEALALQAEDAKDLAREDEDQEQQLTQQILQAQQIQQAQQPQPFQGRQGGQLDIIA